MTTRNAELAQANKGVPPDPPLPSPAEQLRTRVCNTVFKTGPLLISSKGIGWTSWKKRWFILTRTSLVFFRSDPSAVPQKGSEVNLTLGGIDLNNSGSVVVKEDKKLLTVLFPDGRDGRTFTLKAETLEDLQEWKTALENALAQAPNHPTGQNGIFRNGQNDSVDGSLDQSIDRCPIKVPVVGRPILIALEDVDGSPSFLEKALQYIEEHGVKVEGILRQAADVEDVERRIREYEQGKIEFSSGEDAHVIGDCVKYVIRELPSSPVPASCCKALLQACRTERSIRVNAMRTAICETFPEPNRRLLQRILKMMQKVASHKAENRMSCSAVAACMAPLLLRPLLAGECEIENDFDLGGDGSAQLLQAAAAANHAQAIVITLLDEYDKIFGEGSVSPEPYTDSEESGSGSEEATDDESYEDDEDDDSSQGSYPGADDDLKNASSETCSESGDSGYNSPCDDKDCASSTSGSDSPEVGNDDKPKQNISNSRETPIENVSTKKNSNSSALPVNVSAEVVRYTSSGASSVPKSTGHGVPLCIHKSTAISNGPMHSVRNRSAWRRTAGRKNLSMESIDYGVEEEVEIQRLEVTKSDLENRIVEEVKENAVLQTNLEIRKKDLHQRRLALEQDVARLQEQLKKERDLRAALEAGLNMFHGPLPDLTTIDEKTKAELEEVAAAQADVVNLTEKLGELGMQLNQQRELHHGSLPKLGVLPYKSRGHQNKTYEYLKDKQKDSDISPPHFERSRKKDPDFCGTESENKDLSQSQQQEPLRSVNYRSIGVSADSSTDQSVISRHASSRRSFTKNERTRHRFDRSLRAQQGTVSTNSALTKLTTRLNFLKERRTQIAHELQNMDKNIGLSAISQNLGKGREPLQNTDKSQGSEVQAAQNHERGRESDSYDLFLNFDRGMGTEGQLFQNPDRLRKAESHSLNYADRGKRSDVHNSHGLDRGKSDNHLSLNVGKGRVVEGDQPFNSSRTSTRL